MNPNRYADIGDINDIEVCGMWFIWMLGSIKKIMKIIKTTFFILITTVLCGFSYDFGAKINKCFISFDSAAGLKAFSPDKLPKSSMGFRSVETKDGKKFISRNAGYRILFKNNKGAPFVNLKIERSDDFSYDKDKTNLKNNLKWLISMSENLESNDLMEQEFNGYKVYEFSRNGIESGNTLGTFVMFPEPNIIVYFYFNNLRPDHSNFDSWEDYKSQREGFIDAYTKHIRACIQE